MSFYLEEARRGCRQKGKLIGHKTAVPRVTLLPLASLCQPVAAINFNGDDPVQIVARATAMLSETQDKKTRAELTAVIERYARRG